VTKLGLFCERLLEAGWLVAVATVPMYFNIYSSRVFEPDKITMLRSLVVVMALAQLVKWLESGIARTTASSNGDRQVAAPAVPVWWRWWPGNPLALPTLVVVATYLLGTVVSVTPAVSIWGSYQRMQGTYSMLAYIVLFFLMAANLRRRAQIERLFNVILLVSVPIALYGIIQHQRLDPLPWGGDVTARVTSTMGNAIFLAAYLIMVVPITLHRLIGTVVRLRRFGPIPNHQLFDGWPRLSILAGVLGAELLFLALFTALSAQPISLWWAVLPVIGTFVALSLLFTVPRQTYLTTLVEAVAYIFLLALQLTAILLTQSRGPWLGLLAGLGCFAIVLFVRRRAWSLLALSSALGALLLVFLVLFNLPDSPFASLRQIPYLGRLGALLETEGGTGRVRILIWQGTSELMTTRPPVGLGDSDSLGPARPLFGYGPEAMYVAYNKVYPPELAHFEARNASPDRNHNDLLDHLVEVGVLGLIAYLFLLGAVGYLIWQHLRRAVDLVDQLPLVAILSALVAHFVESQTGIVIAATRTYFWVYLSVIVAGGLFYSHQKKLAATHSESELLVAATPTPLAAAATRAKRRRGQRPASGSASLDGRRPGGALVGAGALQLSGASPLPYPVLALVMVVLFSVMLLSRTLPVSDAQLPLYLSFLGLVIATCAVALSLGTFPAARFWRASNWWAYALGALVVTFVVVQNLNVVAADIYYKRGLGYDQARRFDGSIQEYNRALALAGDQDYYYLFFGRAFLELAKQSPRPKAASPFVATPESIRGLTAADLSALGREDLLEASRVALETARDLNPLNTDHYANLGRLYRVRGEMGDRAKLDQASQYYKEATTLSPRSVHLYVEWAQVELTKGAPEQALEKAEIAASLDPIFPNTFLVMGDIYQVMQRYDDALAAHGKALALAPAILSDPGFEQRVAAYDKAGRLEGFASIYAKAAQDAPKVAAVHSAYGFILTRQNKLNEALEQFQVNVRLSPNDWVGHRNIALVYQSLGMIDQAIASAQLAQRYAPPDQAGNLQSFVAELQKKKR
jgi:tetratricopeptide (TPR) repeat protein